MTTIRQPQRLSTEESAFAAEHFQQVYSFLNENDLPEEIYYDSAINGFLMAVKQCFSSSDTCNFTKVANALMRRECEQYDVMAESEPRIFSFDEYYQSAYVLEEHIVDIKNTMEDAISSIAIEETMQTFTEIQQEIVRLLMGGYSKMDIASMLTLSMNTLSNEICSIQRKTLHSPLMNAA